MRSRLAARLRRLEAQAHGTEALPGARPLRPAPLRPRRRDCTGYLRKRGR